MIINNKIILFCENNIIYENKNKITNDLIYILENLKKYKKNIIIYYDDLNDTSIEIFLMLKKMGYNYYNNTNLKNKTYNTFIDFKNQVSYILLRDGNRWVKLLNMVKIFDEKKNRNFFYKNFVKIIKKYGNESTIGNYAIKIFKKINENIELKKYYDVLDNKEFKFCENAFRSGLNILEEKKKNKLLSDVNIIDINSLYPYIMKSQNLPVRKGVYFIGKYNNDELYSIYIQHIKANFKIKKNKIAFLSNKNIFINKNLETSGGRLIDLYLTNYDLKNFIEHYEIYELYYVDGYKYCNNNKLYSKFINKFYKLKNSNKENKKFYKLLLNSLFGKMCSKKNIIKKEPCFENEKLFFKTCKNEIKTAGGYIPVGVFITSIARDMMLKYIEKVKNNFIYCDTDSIHFLNNKNLKFFKISKKIGDFKVEMKKATAKYLKLKTYIIYNKSKIKKVIAGVPKENLKNININNFKIGKNIDITKKIIKNNKIIKQNFKIKI